LFYDVKDASLFAAGCTAITFIIHVALFEKPHKALVAFVLCLGLAVLLVAVLDHIGSTRIAVQQSATNPLTQHSTISETPQAESVRRTALDEATAYANADDWADAINTLNSALEKLPADPQLTQQLRAYQQSYAANAISQAEVFAEQGQYDSAISVLNSAQSLLPGNSDLATEVARITLMKPVYFETIQTTGYSRYTGNEGDSDIVAMGQRGDTGENGVTYQHGLDVWVARWNYQDEISWVWRDYLLPQGSKALRGTLTVAVDCYNHTDFDTTLEIRGDEKNVLFSQRMTPNVGSVPIDISVDGFTAVRISARDNVAKSGGTCFLLGDLSVSRFASSAPSPQTSALPSSASTTGADASPPAKSGEKYQIYDVGMTWDDAKAYCKSQGRHLATITSQSEQDAVVQVIEEGTMESYWLGGEEIDGTWSWITGEKFDWTYWDSGEPNGSGDRLQIYSSRYPSGIVNGWDDTYASGDQGGGLTYSQIGAVCEK